MQKAVRAEQFCGLRIFCCSYINILLHSELARSIDGTENIIYLSITLNFKFTIIYDVYRVLLLLNTH